MNQIGAASIAVLLICGGFALGFMLGLRSWNKRFPEPSKIDALDLTKTRTYSREESRQIFLDNPPQILTAEDVDFAVARSPRHIPWSRRKKELEASARQKRRHLESFTEPQ